MNHREAILEAVTEAKRVHKSLGSEDLVRAKGGGVDVFGAIRSQKIELLFQPLQKLLGGYLPEPVPGILVTSERSLAIQRFTGAHEFGHYVLKHPASLDSSDILSNDPKSFARHDLNETAANAFAGDFLLPFWVFESHAERQGWKADSFIDPLVVYQLSLRVGASFEATTRQLLTNDIIDRATLTSLLKVSPKSLKQAFLGGRELEHWRRDVWLLTERDQGTVIQGGPEDIFIFRLKQNSGAGYLWSLDDLEDLGFSVMFDTVNLPDADADVIVGSPIDRFTAAMVTHETTQNVTLIESQPWDPDSVSETLSLDFDLFREKGQSQNQRRAIAAGV